MDWQQLEDAYFAAAKREILAVMRANPGHTFYAAALHDSYRELDGQLCLPCVGLNSVEKLGSQPGSVEVSYDYAPANWDWSGIVPETKRLVRLHGDLQGDANRSTQKHWFRTEKRFMSTMVRVAKRLYKGIKGRKQTTAEFVVYFDDEDGDLELIRKCLPKAFFKMHFGHHDEGQQQRESVVATLPHVEKMRAYLDDYETYETEILEPGQATIDALLANLKDNEISWRAARFLGSHGVASVKVIKGLRQKVRRSTDAASWSARALGILGDTDFLLKLTDDETTRCAAVSGLAAPLLSWANDSVKPIPLNYCSIERLLKKTCPKCTTFAKEQLAPGRCFVEIDASDIDEAIRGLTSPHLVIRQHAVSILDDRSLGKAVAKKVLPALVETLNDRHPNVRRLAILSISSWKAAAKPYLAEILKMKKDPDADVRSTAQYALQ